MGLPTAGSTSTLGPVGTTVQALSIPNPSSNIPQRTPIGVLLLAVSYEPRPPGHSPSTSPLPPGAPSYGMAARGAPQRCPGGPASGRATWEGCYSAVVPPSMTNSLPVTKDDSSEVRYNTP